MVFGTPEALTNPARHSNVSKIMPFFRKALTNSRYYPTYGAYAGAGVLMMIMYFEWTWISRKVPIWRDYRRQIYPGAFEYYENKAKK